MPPVLFFLWMALSIWGILWFHTYFRLFFYFCEIYHQSFDKDCIESIGSRDILTIWILLIHEHGMSFLLFVFLTFHQRLAVFSVQNFMTLIKFITKYFIVFNAIVNGIILFIFQKFCCWHIESTIDFHMLILYSITLLDLFISSN